MSSRFPRIIRNILLFTRNILIILIIGEGILRLFHFHQIVRFTNDPELPFVMTPGQSAYTEISRYPVTINSRSMREREISAEKPRSTYRIIFLGDSVTYGEGIPQQDLFTVIMGEKLAGKTEGDIRYEVLNAGVKGYNNEHEYLFFKSRCLDLSPDLVLLGYCVNDQMLSGGANPRQQGFSLKYKNTGLKKYIKETATYTATYRLIRTIAASFMDLPPWYLDFIRQGVPTPDMREKWESSSAALTRLSELCRSNGIEFGIVIFPIEPQLREDYDTLEAQPQERLRQFALELGILFIDPLDTFRRNRDQEIYTDQIHLTRFGHRLAADEIVRQLAQWDSINKEATNLVDG